VALKTLSLDTFNKLCPRKSYTAAVTVDGWLELLLEAINLSRDDQQYHLKCLLLLQHKASEMITTSGLLALLQAALEQHATAQEIGLSATLLQLWSHPAAAGITPELLLPLLESAVETGAGVGFICQWAAAKQVATQLRSVQLVGLLHMALDRISNSSTLNVTSTVTSGSIYERSFKACSTPYSKAVDDMDVVTLLSQCSAAASIPADQLAGLLHKCLDIRSKAFTAHNSHQAVVGQSEQLCQDAAGKPTLWPVAAMTAAVERLTVQQAAESLCSSSLQALCSCRAAAGLNGQQLSGLVHAALDSRDMAAARTIVRFAAVGQIGRQTEVLLQLLQSMMSHNSSGSSAKGPAQLNCSSVAQSTFPQLQPAGHDDVCRATDQLTGQKGTDCAGGAAGSSEQHLSSCGSSHCAFPAGVSAASLSCTQLEALLTAAVQRGDGCMVRALGKCLDASKIDLATAHVWLMSALSRC
jgi:hypothetical protein